MKDWIWYASLQTLSVIQKKKLLEVYQSPTNLLKATPAELMNFSFLKPSNREELLQKRNETLLVAYEKYMQLHGIQMVNITDKEYPEKLKQIYDPPISLFLKGNLQLLKEFAIAEIGCREPSEYGREIAYQMAYALAKKNIVVISGMAKGIDGIAHRAALDANRVTLNVAGKTIAVLGSGVDVPYPMENIEIYKKILEKGGLLVSEFLVGTRPTARNFPRRNRIISGLADGVLVIEAKKKSGTMITVDFALEQGKNVYVVPGNINSIYSEGTNELIKQGAKLVSKVEDILEDYLHFACNTI